MKPEDSLEISEVGVLLGACPSCGRESYLWSGEMCDVCDRDSDGIADALEPISTGVGQPQHSLFDVPETGWLIRSMHYETLVKRDDAIMGVYRRLQAKLTPWRGLKMAGTARVTLI